jgi:hypothetical protein
MWGSVQIEYVIDFVFHAGIGSDWLDNVLAERKRKGILMQEFVQNQLAAVPSAIICRPSCRMWFP